MGHAAVFNSFLSQEKTLYLSYWLILCSDWWVNLLITLILGKSLILHTESNVESGWLTLGSNFLSASLDYGAVFFCKWWLRWSRVLNSKTALKWSYFGSICIFCVCDHIFSKVWKNVSDLLISYCWPLVTGHLEFFLT